MPLKTPRFWQEKGFFAVALLPISGLYYAAHKIKTIFSIPYISSIPVLCIGGVVAGGSGKTPVLHAVLRLIRDHNLYQNPVILTRGYGGSLKGPTGVDPGAHTAKEVGDEALLHVGHANTIVSKDRAAGAKLAQAMGADIILMDDGLQNCSLRKNISLLVVDAKQGLGNGWVLPSGPLREPLKDALKKCVAIIQTNGKENLKLNGLTFKTNLSIISTHDMGLNYFGFAGLGNPEKFKVTLEENGFKLSGFIAFPDHHPYSAKDLKSLEESARGSRLITTEKDFVRLPEEFVKNVDVLCIEQVFESPLDVLACLKTGLSR